MRNARQVPCGVALSAAFITKGYYESNPAPNIRGMGQIELVDRFIEIAYVTEHIFDKLSRKYEDGPIGVWDYDVSEELGSWIARQCEDGGTLPTNTEIYQQAALLGEEAFGVIKI